MLQIYCNTAGVLTRSGIAQLRGDMSILVTNVFPKKSQPTLGLPPPGLKWSGCSVRIWLRLRLPHSCHRHLSNLPMFGGASARGLFSSSFLVPVSARCIRFLGSTGLCVHPGQWSLPSRGAAVAGPIRPH